jgi:hypothetical protein
MNLRTQQDRAPQGPSEAEPERQMDPAPTADALEAEVGRLIPGPARHWSRDVYAQGVLLELLERLGFRHRMMPMLPSTGLDPSTIVGFGFEDGMRHFSAYHADEGTALVMAAILALRSIRHAEQGRIS